MKRAIPIGTGDVLHVARKGRLKRVITPAGGGSGSGNTGDAYLRPGGVDTYLRPGGVDTYTRP